MPSVCLEKSVTVVLRATGWGGKRSLTRLLGTEQRLTAAGGPLGGRLKGKRERTRRIS